ncbi:MAG: phytanoyl-CoA dioxygenase family protein [Actinomycetia bacterium]|nr:phytanoyl-CoA dioxygenase family protein [Actinomycetes bacterium]
MLDSMVLSAEQIADYENDGFLVLRGQIPEADIARLEVAFARNPPNDGTLGDAAGLTYPEPGRYTLAVNALKDPDFGFIAEHPGVVGPARTLLGDDPRLSAWVLYDRTPGGKGLPSHNDYKRWRPVGSSMNWLFTIIPFCDFDADAGRLWVSPGSHLLDRIHPGRERPLEVDPAVEPDETTYIDTEAHRGDLVIMNMHTWHRADDNGSTHSRAGLFNKYAAASAPPATGWLVYDEDVHDAITPVNRNLIAVHSNRPLETTRAVLTRPKGSGLEVFLLRHGDRWRLPGGPTMVEQAIPDWDRGNYIAACQQVLRDELRIETPWLSWAADVDEGNHRCRVYGYDLPGLGFPVPYPEGEWVTRDQLEARVDALVFGHELEAVDAWLDPVPIRGKGLSQAASRINQYAY